MGQDHLDNIVINISLDPAPQAGAAFFFPLLIADEANGTTLGGDRVRSYADSLSVDTDEDAGFLSAAVAQAARDALSQIPRPPLIKIGRRDSVGGESYSDAFTAIRLVDDQFYTTSIESRADADILDIAAAVEPTKRKIAVVQTDDTAFKTTGFPAGLVAIDGNERTVIAWHETDTEWMDFAWSSNRLAFDPNAASVSWDAGVQSVLGYPTNLTQAEKDFLDENHANNGLALDGFNFFVDPGHNANGRPIYEIVTLDWFEATLQSRVATMKARRSARGQKVPVDGTGQGLLLALVNGTIDQGEGTDGAHFAPGARRVVEAAAITQEDLDLQRLRFTGQVQLSASARLFRFDLNFTRQPVTG